MRFVVAGGGVAGLAAALAIARVGHEAVVPERDPVDPGGSPEGAFGVARRGIPHYLEPHAFLPRGRQLLSGRAPDVLDALLDAGADPQDVALKLSGPRQPGDEDLVVGERSAPVGEEARARVPGGRTGRGRGRERRGDAGRRRDRCRRRSAGARASAAMRLQPRFDVPRLPHPLEGPARDDDDAVDADDVEALGGPEPAAESSNEIVHPPSRVLMHALAGGPLCGAARSCPALRRLPAQRSRVCAR